MLELKYVKADIIKHKNHWESGLRINESAKSKVGRVECRSIIETDDGRLMARVWIWVKDVNRSELEKVLRRKIKKLPQTPKYYSSYSVVIAAVDLGEASGLGRTKQSIIDELVSPLFKLTKGEWNQIFLMTA